MIAGPYVGRGPIDQAILLARAMTGYGPALLDEKVASEVNRRYLEQILGPTPPNTWIREMRTGRPDVFMQVDEHGSGRNVTALPAGERARFVVDARGAAGVRMQFADFVARYKLLQYGEINPVLVSRFDRVLLACSPRHYLEASMAVSSRIRQAGGFHEDTAGRLIAVDGRLVWTSVDGALADMKLDYQQYATDSWVIGNLQLARDAAMCFAAVSTGDGRDWTSVIAQYFRVPWSMPIDFSQAVVVRAIDGGALDQLLAVGDQRRDELDVLVEHARNAADVDEMLDRIHVAAPLAHVCEVLYSTLMDASVGNISDERRSLWRRIHKLIRERRGRLLGSLAISVEDMDGHHWLRCLNGIAHARQVGGLDAAEAKAHDAVDKNMWYPRSLLPALLEARK